MTLDAGPSSLLGLLASNRSDRTAVIQPEKSISLAYGALRAQVEAVAGALAAVGVRRGTRVAIALPNGLPMVVCFLAASEAGTAAPLNPGYLEEEFRFYLEAAFGAPVVEAYGMTEAAHQMASNPLPPGQRLPGSVGRGTGVRISIMDAEGRHLPPGERGEVVIKGPNVVQGYENNPEANATSFTDGWFRTGDQGVLDEDGYLTLVARIKELIIRGGEKISPLEIDEVLLRHPAVAEAVCFGVPHPTWGEELAAAVVLREPVPAPDLLAFCREHLAEFRRPKRIHITDTIPRTATGKIQRRVVAHAFTQAS